MVRTCILTAALVLAASTAAHGDVPVTLQGSPESMLRQHGVARESGYRFYHTPSQVRSAESRGELVALFGSEFYDITRLSFPVARPQVRVFIEKLAEEYHAGCGERLVVTSLTRAHVLQPPNAHPLSVHPAGMAIDLRIPRRAECRVWLEARLLELEEKGVLDATREHAPPHYHVALFTSRYDAFLERETETARLAAERAGYEAALAAGILNQQIVTRAAVTPRGASEGEAEATTGLRSLLGRIFSIPGRILGALRG